MNEMIRTMVEVLKDTEGSYIKADLGDYSIFIADKETAEFFEKAFEEEE